MTNSIWKYRGFILESVKRELYLKFSGSALGPAWLFITPIATVVLFIGVFGYALKGRIPGSTNPDDYWIFLCAGLLPWQLLSDIILRGQDLYINNSAILKKIAIPKIILPIILVISALIQFIIIFSFFLIALVFVGRWPGWPIFSILPLLLGYIALSTGLAMLLAPANVFFRDITPATSLGLLFLFWATPIVYTLRGSTTPLANIILQWNPLAWSSVQLQSLFVNGVWVNVWEISAFLEVSVGILILGAFVFFRSADLISDEL